MNKKSGSSKVSAGKLVKNIRRKTRQTYSAEEKIRIVLVGMRGEESIALTLAGGNATPPRVYPKSKLKINSGSRGRKTF